MMDMAFGAIHLWLADPDGVDEELQATYLSLLSAEERCQQQRFHFERDRRRYLVTRALVRTVLSRYAPVASCDWSFAKNKYGCPRIADTHGAASHIRFNLSHTHNLIVLAVGKDSGALGIDVENVSVRNLSIDVADRFFAPNEVEALRRLEANLQKDRFFEYWTFKEAYIKARGMGLSLPLDQFSFELLQAGAVSFRVAAELEDRASRWRFCQVRPSSDYIVALCAESVSERVTPLSVIRTIPLVWSKRQQLSLSRVSMRQKSKTDFQIV